MEQPTILARATINSISILICLIALAATSTAQAQRAPERRAVSTVPPAVAASATPSSTLSTATDNYDLSITANVTARELLFEVVPNPTVEFPGQPRRDTSWEAERTNLPPQVQPGVTYRDIGIRLRITSVFADIERIVAEALGETPLSDNEQLEPDATVAPPGDHISSSAPIATLDAATADAVSPTTVSTNTSRPSSARTTPARSSSSSSSVTARQRKP